MTNLHLHAHVEQASSDCDGPLYRSHVMSLTEHEVERSVRANGINDFVELEFKERVLGSVVFFSPDFHASVSIDKDGFEYNEPTDEGHRRVSVQWCENEGCDPKAYTQRDVYAEMMGY